MLQHRALMVLFALLVDPTAVREGLRSVIRTIGVQFVIIPGATSMLKLCVFSLDIHAIVMVINFIADLSLYHVTCAGAIAYSNAHFGQGFGGIFLSNVLCTGTESSLFDCPHAGIGVHNCQHFDDAGVSCSRKFMWSYVAYLCLISFHNWCEVRL